MAHGSLDLDDQLCFALYAASHAITRVYRERLEPLGLTYPQYLVLLTLFRKSPCSVSEISATLKQDPAALSPLLKRMAAARFIHRARDVNDERVVLVSLGHRGEALNHELTCIQQDVVCRTGLSDCEFAALRANLHELVGQLSARDAESVAML